jgi:hypothetical protein
MISKITIAAGDLGMEECIAPWSRRRRIQAREEGSLMRRRTSTEAFNSHG